LRLGGGSDIGRGGRGEDHIRAVDGSKDDISCGPGSDLVKANPGDDVTGGCEKVISLAEAFSIPHRWGSSKGQRSDSMALGSA
jgi:hypothetical protein